ncbi:MAG: MotA/TolQ/ExbB proton channel family protein [Phycisphaerae bacterium]|nr:MotA/TolQ/ExbB proton channel family protein [Phycisphaerae bacterium]
MKFVERLGWIGVFALCGAVPALAQDGGEASKSILDIIWAGIEWPTYFIVAGSVVALTLIVEHFLTVQRGTILPVDQVKQAKQLIENRSFRECLDGLKKSRTFFARTMTAAMLHARHGFDAMHEAAVEKSGELSGRMFRKVEYLNIIGNLGPLLGLLGTVLGMIEAFAAMGEGGGSSDAGGLAGGISKALVNTMLGLTLAIIGLGFFGVCRNRVDSLTTAATVEVLDLLEYFRPSAKRAASAEAKAKVPPAD